MTGRRFRIAVPILLGLALASNGQEPSLWHGRVIGIEDAPDGHRQNLTYTLKEIADIAPLPTLRRMYSPSISGNGKLLFVPTGPNTWPAKKFSASAYIDQIDVYDAMTLVGLRSLHSQRPLLDVIPDQDGGRLFAAIPGRPSFLILNSNTLWQEEDHLTQFPIRKMTLLP
jgi:hypothetical protein